MTQLGELRDAWPDFLEAGVKLYAISYDDREALAAFADAHDVPYPLLSDADSAVIRRFGILNDEVAPGDLPLYGVPFPGAYVVDASGVVIAKFFHDTYKKRESPEILIDSALGRTVLRPDEPSASALGDEVRVTAVLHGGRGALKQGSLRQVVVRFELPEGQHIYGEPVPEGMIPTVVEVTGPDGLVVGEPIRPPTETLRLESLDVELPVWSGTVDFIVPVHALSRLASEVRPLEKTSAQIDVNVRFQACDERVCLRPRTERLSLQVPIEPINVPNLGLFTGNGQRETTMNSARYVRRLVLRQLRNHPLGVLRSIARQIGLELAARRRRKREAALQ